jgi:oligoribonuclease NrnB/cAMP/cGMP phosphodiesterase (DHH superfamily)
MSIKSLLAHHELLRNVPMSGPEVERHGSSGTEGHPFKSYTSHELSVAERMDELEKKLQSTVLSKVLVIHDIDLDGTVAGVQMMRWLDQSVISTDRTDVGILHGHGFEAEAKRYIESRQWTAVIILDHIFNSNTYKLCQDHTDYTVWFDHHPVPEKDQETEVETDNSIFFITPTYSTAELVWRAISILYNRQSATTLSRYYCQERLAYTTHHYDTWSWRKNDGKPNAQDLDAVRLNDWFSLEKKSKDILYAMLCSQDSVDGYTAFACYYKLLDCGDAISKVREMIHKTVNDEFTGKCWWSFEGEEHKVAYVMHSDSRSMLSDAILSQMPDVDIVCVVFYSVRDKLMRLSLRSRENGPSLSRLCEFLGGGGHAHAAGFSVQPSDLGLYLQSRVFKVPSKEEKAVAASPESLKTK